MPFKWIGNQKGYQNIVLKKFTNIYTLGIMKYGNKETIPKVEVSTQL